MNGGSSDPRSSVPEAEEALTLLAKVRAAVLTTIAPVALVVVLIGGVGYFAACANVERWLSFRQWWNSHRSQKSTPPPTCSKEDES